MEKHDEYFQAIVSDIPYSELEKRVLIYIAEAEITMGSDFDIRGNNRIIDIIRKEFDSLPLYAIAGAFKKGSLGQYGPGRLTIRTIYGWISDTFTAYTEQTKNIQKKEEEKKFDDLINCPLGSAIIRKIDMYKTGRLSIDGKTAIPSDECKDWDSIPLKSLAESIAGEKL